MPLQIKICVDCGHPVAQHRKEFGGCRMCAVLAMRYGGMSMVLLPNYQFKTITPCKEVFKSDIPQLDLEQAITAPKDAFDGKTECAVCGATWYEHEGFLCPNGNTLFQPFTVGKGIV